MMMNSSSQTPSHFLCKHFCAFNSVLHDHINLHHCCYSFLALQQLSCHALSCQTTHLLSCSCSASEAAFLPPNKYHFWRMRLLCDTPKTADINSGLCRWIQQRLNSSLCSWPMNMNQYKSGKYGSDIMQERWLQQLLANFCEKLSGCYKMKTKVVWKSNKTGSLCPHGRHKSHTAEMLLISQQGSNDYC